MENDNGDIQAQQKTMHKGKHDKPKPWDDPSIDHWKVQKFDPSWNDGGMLEVSTFSTLFPQYRERYLQEVWPIVKGALKEHGIACELNLIYNYQTVNEDYNVVNTPTPNKIQAATPAAPPLPQNDIVDDDDDEEPLNENDDDEEDLDDVDQGEELNTQHLILAQFDKVTRTKSRWKCGIIHINSKDILFNKNGWNTSSAHLIKRSSLLI